MEEQTAHEIVQSAQWPDSGLSAQSLREVRGNAWFLERTLLVLPEFVIRQDKLAEYFRWTPKMTKNAAFSAWRMYRDRAVLRELMQVPSETCPKCKGEQEIVSEFEFRDMDGSRAGYTVLACGHNGPQECDSGFSLGPDHDPYGVHCELDRSCHAKDERGRIIHRGHNPLPAPGQEIMLWTGGGYCAGDPLPRTVVGYESEPAR